MADGILVLGDQLHQGLPGLPSDVPVFMAEDWGLCTRDRHHQQKLVLFLSAMRHFAEDLGERVHYEELKPDQPPLLERLAKWAEAQGIETIHTYTPNDRFFRQEMEDSGLTFDLHHPPMFVTQDEHWQEYRESSDRLLMADFYIQQRRRHGLLLTENGKPVGGQWSYDADNRKPLPKQKRPPAAPEHRADEITQDVVRLVKKHFADHPGDAEQFSYGVTRKEALYDLRRFIEERLADFGPYEDSIGKEEDVLWHSVLTPYLNTGLLAPEDCLVRAVEAYEDGLAPLQSVEGFVRQIVGWREFIKRIDGLYEEEDRICNPFDHQRTLKPCWWDGTTGLPPLDAVIKRVERKAWCHHIERLMILGSVMLMSEVAPKSAFDWFMENFIDSAHWVMAPNVYGMSQWADGGLFATKPYISGSSYIRKMSDWGKGDWCDTWDGLYWRFLDRNRNELESNPRMTMMFRQLDRLDGERRERIFAAAEDFIHRTTEE